MADLDLSTLPFADRTNKNTPQFTENISFNLEKDGSPVTLISAHSADKVPLGLLQAAFEEFNYVIDEGRTYPHYQTMSYDEFLSYLFDGFAAILVLGEYTEDSDDDTKEQWEKRYMGHFYVKPNYIGRCSHVCNAGFVVNHNVRGKGLGKELGRKYLEIAPKLGYVYSVFNLVFETNVASMRIWDSLGFDRIGYIKNVAALKGEDNLVGAHMYGYDFKKPQ